MIAQYHFNKNKIKTKGRKFKFDEFDKQNGGQ